MKAHIIEVPQEYTTHHTSTKDVLLVALTLILLIPIIPLHLLNDTASPLQPLSNDTDDSASIKTEKTCDISRGSWVRGEAGPYYTNETCRVIYDYQNCLLHGRPDTDYLNWRWKPEECEMPMFDAVQFLELVKGKSLAFVGDSVARNQMQSLVCLLSSAGEPLDVSDTPDGRFKRWFYTDYNFTISSYFAPYLVKFEMDKNSSFGRNSLMNLYLDEPDEAWAAKIENFDYVILSAGQWFFRPLGLYRNNTLVGYRGCQIPNITEFTYYYAYQNAFRTAFDTLRNLQNYTGMTILRTFSPSHFENGVWNQGGNCPRKLPYGKDEPRPDGYSMEFYKAQMEELRKAETEGERKGLRFGVLGTTDAMLMRPDGHPNYYGHWPQENVTIADCVHWCLPGPIDTWNEFLMHVLKTEAGRTNFR